MSAGDGGNLTVNAAVGVEVIGTSGDQTLPSSISSETFASGNAGNLQISTPQLLIRDGATVTAGAGDLSRRYNTVPSTGNAGDLTVTASLIELSGTSGNQVFRSSLLTGTAGSGEAGDLQIDTNQLILRNGALVLSGTLREGESGNLTVNASESVEVVGTAEDLLPSSISTGTLGTGVARDLTINTKTLTVRDGALVSAATYGQGTGGNLTVNASEQVELAATAPDGRPSGLSAGSGIEGVSSIPLLQNWGVDPSQATGESGNLNIVTGQLIVRDGAEVSTATLGRGRGGTLSVNAEESVNLSRGGRLTTETQGSADAGNLTIETGRLTVQAQALVSASTSGSGTGGSLTVNADAVTVSNEAQLSVETSSIGSAGTLRVNTRQLSVEDGGQVSAATSASGRGGNLQVNASDSIMLNNQGRLLTQASGTGEAGDITIQTPQLRLEEGAEVSASTTSSTGGDITLQNLENLQVRNSRISASTETGTAGNLTVNARESIQLRGVLSDGTPGGLLAQASNGGDARSLSIHTRQLRVEDGAQATVSSTGTGSAGNLEVTALDVQLNNQARLTAETEAGQGGNITLLNLERLQVFNSHISASTQTGTAGNLTVNARESIQLSGSGGLGVEATAGGTAGDLTVETQLMSVREGAQVSVSSPRGQAGNLAIRANSLVLNRGSLTAETGTSGAEGGANIRITGLDWLLMRNESLISADAFGAANGGNITIDTRFLIALPPEGVNGSDIIANAFAGNGGRVSITTQGIFGIEFRPELTPLNDITASSEFGSEGIVDINTLGVDPSRGLANLPAELGSPELIQGCQAEGSQISSRFVNTGRGGLPLNPYEPLGSREVLGDVYPPAQWRENTAVNLSPTTTSNQIVEAEGWIINEKGKVILIAEISPKTFLSRCLLHSPRS